MKHVTENAVLKRVNRRLAPQFERVGINRHRSDWTPYYYHLHAYSNSLLGEFDDLEAFARDCGALADDEVIR
ncbi:hypothetical protein [Lacipirellula parvula]|uniref:hypothetical protein n=1 Tax=Lacipirellula parvula TaxID=2650471 RepID=UPI0012606825|nr:hypothetical protein [Lacipirellula parvula]